MTKIEWADETWNPTLGCDRVSPGCDNCYAVRTATIRAGNPHPGIAQAYAGLTERTDAGLDWTGVVRLLPERLDKPLWWRKPRRIFVDSQSDLFHKDIPDEFIARVFAVMAATPQHTYQILTKRHGRMRALLRSEDFQGDQLAQAWFDAVPRERRTRGLIEWPLRNVWLGVSVEDQKHADLRILALLDTPAAVRWLSCEPLLGPVDLRRMGPRRLVSALDVSYDQDTGAARRGIDWVVVGGESGPRARPMHPDWARQLRDQCTTGGVPFFFKQWGESAPLDQLPAHAVTAWEIRHGGGFPSETLCQVGKKAAGAELDGQVWEQFPAAAREETSR